MAKHIANLLNSPERWTQGALGRTQNGTPVQSFDVLFTTNQRGQPEEHDKAENVKTFSLYGAVARCYDIDRREQVLEKLRSAIRRATGRNDFIAQFNDRPETTFKDIITVIRDAEV